jgi:hypothetical protein
MPEMEDQGLCGRILCNFVSNRRWLKGAIPSGFRVRIRMVCVNVDVVIFAAQRRMGWGVVVQDHVEL